MCKIPNQRRKKILGFLSGHAHVEGVRAKIYSRRPLKGTYMRNFHFLKKSGLMPCRKNPSPRIRRKINDPRNPILKSQEEAKFVGWLYFYNLHHSQLLQKPSPV